MLTDIIRDHGGRLISILTSYDRVPKHYRKLYVRAFAINREDLLVLKGELEGCAKLLYMIDHRENKRELGNELVPSAAYQEGGDHAKNKKR